MGVATKPMDPFIERSVRRQSLAKARFQAGKSGVVLVSAVDSEGSVTLACNVMEPARAAAWTRTLPSTGASRTTKSSMAAPSVPRAPRPRTCSPRMRGEPVTNPRQSGSTSTSAVSSSSGWSEFQTCTPLRRRRPRRSMVASRHSKSSRPAATSASALSTPAGRRVGEGCAMTQSTASCVTSSSASRTRTRSVIQPRRVLVDAVPILRSGGGPRGERVGQVGFGHEFGPVSLVAHHQCVRPLGSAAAVGAGRVAGAGCAGCRAIVHL